MLSQTAEYAIRAVLTLARAGTGSTVTADSVAAALGAPANYLSKTLHQLARVRIVEGVRGPAGGFRLIRRPADLTLAEIVRTFDEPVNSGRCLMGGRACNAADPCAAHDEWIRVTREMSGPLLRTTVADLLRDDVQFREAV